MARSAQLYRMVTDEHICPFGLKSKDLLEREGFDVEDHPLESREETDRFMEKHDVDTTPQTFIDGKRVGGYESLLEYFGKDVSKGDETTYTPVIATFSVTFLMALGLTWSQGDGFWLVTLIEWFIAISMCALAIQKLKDPEAFLNQFITYDLLAMKKLRYAYVYPALEAFAGIGMLAALPAWLVSPPAFFIGTVGAVSVYKAVYIDKRELKCACVGGDSNVPLGFISLTENLMMVAMAIWMWVR